MSSGPARGLLYKLPRLGETLKTQRHKDTGRFSESSVDTGVCFIVHFYIPAISCVCVCVCVSKNKVLCRIYPRDGPIVGKSGPLPLLDPQKDSLKDSLEDSVKEL